MTTTTTNTAPMTTSTQSTASSTTINSTPTKSTPTKPLSVVKVHSPPHMTQSPEKKTFQSNSKTPRKSSNKSSSPSPPPAPILPTTKRPHIPKEKPITNNKTTSGTTTGSTLRPPVPTKHRRSRADTGDSDVSGVSSVGDLGDLDDVASGDEGEHTDYETADADLPKTASPNTTGALQSTTSPSMGTRDIDDDDDNSSIIARANAVWS